MVKKNIFRDDPYKEPESRFSRKFASTIKLVYITQSEKKNFFCKPHWASLTFLKRFLNEECK